METTTHEQSGRLAYKEHDLISVPEDVPSLEVKRDDEGIVRELVLLNEEVTAFVEIPYSTGQTRGWILMKVMPEEKVLSYTVEG